MGSGVYSGAGSLPATWSDNNYLMARWNWDNVGTFASAPIFTAYNNTSHNSPTTRNSPAGGLLEGHATDTDDGGTVRSYLKANAYGQVGAAGAASGATPAASDGTTGSVSPTAGTNWLAAYQALAADLDFITAPFTPAATTAGVWHVMFLLYLGPNTTPGTFTPVLSLKYTWI